jgi:hypothetical protein
MIGGMMKITKDLESDKAWQTEFVCYVGLREESA